MLDQSADNLPSTFDDGELYDLVADGIPYGMDFYIELAGQAQGPVLDIACGTGRILLPCLMAGIDMEGLGFFEPMLAGFNRWEIHGDFDGRPLTRENYAMVVTAWNS